MSEWIYSCLLQLYPASFRRTYGDAAIQLFRDRLKDERGFRPRLHLWLDLFFDLVSSVPRTHCFNELTLVSASAQRLCGVPSFYVLEHDPLRPSAILIAGVLAAATLCGLSMLMGRAGVRRPLLSAAQSATVTQQLNSFLTSKSPMLISSDEPDQVLGSGIRAELIPASKPPFIKALFLVVAPELKLDAVERQRIIEAAISNLKQHYFDQNATQRITDSLHAHEKNGDYNTITDGSTFANLLTKQIREVGQDMHLIVEYSANPLPTGPPAPPPGAIERYHEALRQNNCTFEKVDILPHNIGYLKLNSFPDISVCRSTAVAAMAQLNNADAIIFDLRDNQGGYPEMVSLIASYLFNHPVDWYDPRDDSTQPSRMQPRVPHSGLADKPVYVLTSGRTISGAEQFSYNLKMLKRATLIGETTAGHAHIGTFYRLDDHFGMGIPETKPINPYGKVDWEGIGVEPDVKINSADALETAERLAQSNAGR
jgi:hypothetical protein